MTGGKRDFPVTLKVVREYTATVVVPSCRDQAEADREALALYDEWRSDLDSEIRIDLGFPPPWTSTSRSSASPRSIAIFAASTATRTCATAKLHGRGRCLGRDRTGAARRHAVPRRSRAPHRSVARYEDFTAIVPSAPVWDEHVRSRYG